MIIYSSTRPPNGDHVSKFDRFVLLRRLASLTEAHDNLLAAGMHGSDEARRIRHEARRALQRLGLSSGKIHEIFSASGPLPRFDERETADPADDEAWAAAEAKARERGRVS